MDSVIDINAARALVSDAAAWPLVRDFLWDFAPQVHESWLDGLYVSSDGASLPSVPVESPRVKRFTLEALGVKPFAHTFPKEDFSRLLLLDGATILEVAKWTGAIASSEQLRRVTDGATVRSLKAALPGVYPDVFGFTAYFSKWKMEKAEGQTDGAAVCRLGCRILFSILKELPQPLLRRLSLKLPKDIRGGEGEDSDDSRFSVFNFQFLAKLLKLRFPEAFTLCC